jgi:DNA-binding ferritin-like protein
MSGLRFHVLITQAIQAGFHVTGEHFLALHDEVTGTQTIVDMGSNKCGQRALTFSRISSSN